MAEKKDVKETKQEKAKKEKMSTQERWLKVLAEVPEKLPVVEGFGYFYTPLPAILNSIRPILTKYGFGLSQEWDYNEVKKIVEIRTIIYSEDGEFKRLENKLPIVEMSNIVQGIGATITYGRRYSISALLGIATEEDTDASIETGKSNNSQKATGEEFLKYKNGNKEAKPRSDLDKGKELIKDEQLRRKLAEIWDRIIEARDLSLLSMEDVAHYRKAIMKITTMAGAEAFEKMIYRVVEQNRGKRAGDIDKADNQPAEIEVESTKDIEENPLL